MTELGDADAMGALVAITPHNDSGRRPAKGLNQGAKPANKGCREQCLGRDTGRCCERPRRWMLGAAFGGGQQDNGQVVAWAGFPRNPIGSEDCACGVPRCQTRTPHPRFSTPHSAIRHPPSAVCVNTMNPCRDGREAAAPINHASHASVFSWPASRAVSLATSEDRGHGGLDGYNITMTVQRCVQPSTSVPRHS